VRGLGRFGGNAHVDADVINARELALLLRVGRNRIYALVDANKLPFRRVGRHLRFSRRAIMRWLECGQLQGAKEGQ
jgi:excisionase family DNA binding protein